MAKICGLEPVVLPHTVTAEFLFVLAYAPCQPQRSCPFHDELDIPITVEIRPEDGQFTPYKRLLPLYQSLRGRP